MIKTFDLRARERPLRLYGPPGLRRLFGTLKPLIGRTGYALSVTELDRHDEVPFGTYAISAFPVQHRVEAYGYAFVEQDRPGRFDVATARRLGVEHGPDFGRLQRGETVGGIRPEQVMGEARRGRRLVLSGDTTPC
jgi:ribonuclease Z